MGGGGRIEKARRNETRTHAMFIFFFPPPVCIPSPSDGPAPFSHLLLSLPPLPLPPTFARRLLPFSSALLLHSFLFFFFFLFVFRPHLSSDLQRPVHRRRRRQRLSERIVVPARRHAPRRRAKPVRASSVAVAVLREPPQPAHLRVPGSRPRRCRRRTRRRSTREPPARRVQHVARTPVARRLRRRRRRRRDLPPSQPRLQLRLLPCRCRRRRRRHRPERHGGRVPGVRGAAAATPAVDARQTLAGDAGQPAEPSDTAAVTHRAAAEAANPRNPCGRGCERVVAGGEGRRGWRRRRHGGPQRRAPREHRLCLVVRVLRRRVAAALRAFAHAFCEGAEHFGRPHERTLRGATAAAAAAAAVQRVSGGCGGG
eukprot:Rhum_TRINITY_DN15501_c4_g1::Rhum_TRINITY_DN15501_c4_g1_i1::g.160812::m.160812